MTGNLIYKIGTCHGIYRTNKFSVDIIEMTNDEPANSHFDDVLQWFTEIARQERLPLRIVGILNPEIKSILVKSYGFIQQRTNTIIKHDFLNDLSKPKRK